MTELSYTAWDDNRYQWPPPEGWYQASDGKWWPEGYGPVANQAVTETSDESAVEADDESNVGETNDGSWDDGSSGDESRVDEAVASDEYRVDEAVANDDESFAGIPTEVGDAATALHAGGVTDEFGTGSGYDSSVAEGVAWADEGDEAVADEFDGPEKTAANGTSEVAEPEYGSALDAGAELADSTETAHPAESRHDSESQHDSDSRHDSESRLSTSSAGMAATGFASRTEGGSSSLGLAGWAQTGSSDVRNRVDVSHEYDYSPPDGESDDLLEPPGVSGDDHDLEASTLDTSPDDAPPPDESVVDESVLDEWVTDDAALDASTVDTPAVDASAVDTPTIDTPTVSDDSTLSRLDDLKRQVEQQSFPTNVGAAEATGSDVDVAGFDPTETLDIDPNDLRLESNPYYGGADEADAYGAAGGVGTDEPAAPDTYESDHVTAEPEVVHGYEDRADNDSAGYRFSPMVDAPAEAPAAAETRQYGYEGEAVAPVGDQPVSSGEASVEPQTDYSGTPTLSPMSSPTPKAGRGRMVLYAVIGLLALAVAGVTGYLLFQLQSDDGDVSVADGGATAAVAESDAGPSDLSGQGPGSFSNPHDLDGGVRLTVPLSDEETEVWMLQVREPATASDLDDELVEVTSRVRVRNDSTSGDLMASGLRFVLVSADGSTGTTAAASCSSGDDLSRQAPIEPGKDIEGNVCWRVPAAQATGALLGIESVHAAGRVHVELS